MKVIHGLIASATIGILAGCASTPPETPVPREERIKNAISRLEYHKKKIISDKKDNLRVYAIYSSDYSPPTPADEYPAQNLRVVDPADNSKMVAAKVASIFLMSGQQQLGYSKYDLKGKRTDVQNQSVPSAFNVVRDYLFQQFGAHSQQELFPFEISADRFYLIYESYSGSKEDSRPYELVQTMTFSKIREDSGDTKKENRKFSFACKQQGVKHTMKEWQANDYRLLHDTAKQYSINCANELISKHKADLHAAYIR